MNNQANPQPNPSEVGILFLLDQFNKLKSFVNSSFSKTSKEVESMLTKQVQSFETLSREVNARRGEQGKRGAKGEKGDKGDKGEKGKDGINGKDGNPGAKGEQGEKGVDGKRGPKGKDGLDGKDGSNGRNGVDGKDGKDGKDGSPDSPQDLVKKIQSYTNENKAWLDAKAIKNLNSIISNIAAGWVSTNTIETGTGGSSEGATWGSIDGLITNQTDLINYIAANTGNTSWGDILGTLSNQTDLQAALDLKADSADLDAHIANTSNPHSVTKAQVGLSNADNTSDIDKPISAATQAALDLKADSTDLTAHISDTTNPHDTSDSNLIFTDITTNNASSTKHGFLPKLPDNASQFLNGQGNFVTISGSSVPSGYNATTFTSQTSVNVVHNFGVKPVVQVLDDSGNVLIPLTIVHNTVNDFTVTFSSSSSGSIVSSAGVYLPSVSTLSSNTTLDNSYDIIEVTASGTTITLPTAAGISGKTYTIANVSTSSINITGTGGQTIHGQSSQVLNAEDTVEIYSNGTNWRLK